MATNDIIYNGQDKTIYASQPSSVGERGNSITRINPLSGEVGASVFVGSEPNKMAVSNDGQTIYTRLDSSMAIRRFDVLTQTAVLQFTPLAPFTRLDNMAVQPGNPQVLAVANIEGVAIYDNGVQRPTTGDGGAYAINSIDFGDAATLYGCCNESSGFELVKFTVSGSGETGVRIGNNLISGFGVRIKYVNGLIYSTGGRVVNPINGTLVGVFDSGGSTMAVDPAAI